MKIIMGGWGGSKKVISACSYLLDKYLPQNFDVYFLNVGEFTGHLARGKYINLGNVDDSPVGWVKNLIIYLETIDDEFFILGDDDFFMSRPVDMERYEALLNKMKQDRNIGCAKLCVSIFHKPSEYMPIENGLFMLNNTAEWSAVVQFCIWDRKFLIDLLKRTVDPWEFERAGSERLNKTGRTVIASFHAPFIYPDRSALSRTHPNKVSVLGNKNEDVEELIDKGYLNRDELVMGMWGGPVVPYKKDINHFLCLDGCMDKEYAQVLLGLCLNIADDLQVELFSDAFFSFRATTSDRNLIAYVYQRNHYHLPDDMKGQTVIDVGANIGTFSIAAGRRGAKVYAIEPFSANFGILYNNITLNNLTSLIKPLPFAIGKPGKQKLYYSKSRPDWCAFDAAINSLDARHFETVEVKTLQSVFDEYKIDHCDFLKLDAEGAEHDVVKELNAGLHEKITKIGCEVHNAEKSYKEVLTQLQEFYSIVQQLTEYEYILEHK